MYIEITEWETTENAQYAGNQLVELESWMDSVDQNAAADEAFLYFCSANGINSEYATWEWQDATQTNEADYIVWS